MNDLIDIELEKIEFTNANTSDPNFPEDYEPINNDNLNQIQDNAEDSFDDVNSNFNFLKGIIDNQSLKILWENDAPSIDFNAQTIVLESDDYDYLLVVWKAYKTINRLDSTFTLKGFSGYLNLASDYQVGANYYAATFVREFSRNSDTEYYFSDCYVRYGNSTDRPTSNQNIVPICVLGAKLGGVSNE